MYFLKLRSYWVSNSLWARPQLENIIFQKKIDYWLYCLAHNYPVCLDFISKISWKHKYESRFIIFIWSALRPSSSEYYISPLPWRITGSLLRFKIWKSEEDISSLLKRWVVRRAICIRGDQWLLPKVYDLVWHINNKSHYLQLQGWTESASLGQLLQGLEKSHF